MGTTLMNNMDRWQIAYIAGIIDGEGTVTLTRKHQNENRHVAVTIASTEREILDYVLETIGAGKVTTKRRYQPHHAPSFTYAVYNRQALELLRLVVPYLRSYKAERARLILESYLTLTPRNGKYSAELLEARRRFEADVLSIKPNMHRVEESVVAYA